jgi:hypothetical protein
VSTLIEGSTLIDPPWPEDDWERQVHARAKGQGNIFDSWHQGAPAMLDFIRST